jgi:photosystem II stability/assembly factor-like uncharacterized protein
MRSISILLILLFLPAAAFSQWQTLNSGTSANLRAIYFTNPSTGFAAGSGGTLIKTTNSGISWAPLSSGLSSDINSVYFYNATTGLACGNSGNIIITTNAGSSWNPVVSGVTDNLYAISFFNYSNGVCSGSSGTLLYTTSGGLNWVVAVNGFLSSYYAIHMPSAANAIAGGVNTIFQPLIARTTDGGANWNYSSFYLNSNEGNIRGIYFVDPSTGFAVSNVWNGQGAISYTSNGGINWATQLFTHALNSITFPGSITGYTVGSNGYILKTTDAGTSWVPQASGVTSVLRSVAFTDSLLGFAAGDGGVIIKTTNGGITSVTEVSNHIPGDYQLSQNYPNPFNPVTKIKFQIPLSRGVSALGGRGVLSSLVIFDVMGREVSTLVNQHLNPGTYEVNWDASNYPSGVYVYKLTSGDFTDSKRMILIK